MRRSAWLIGLPVVSLVSAAFISPARAVAPMHACSGPSDLGGGIVATLCMDTNEISGVQFATPQPGYPPETHVRFTSARAHYANCFVHIGLRNPRTGGQGESSFRCTQAANHHEDFAPDDRGGMGCSAGDLVQGWMYVTYADRYSPLTSHRSKSLPTAITCRDLV